MLKLAIYIGNIESDRIAVPFWLWTENRLGKFSFIFFTQLYMNIQAFIGQLSCARHCIFKSSINILFKATSYSYLHIYNVYKSI